MLQSVRSALQPARRTAVIRLMTSSTKPKRTPIGSLLYVPASSDKFLQKSLTSTSPTITYDLEDSIHPSFKESARSNLISFLRSFPSDNAARSFDGLSVAVRPNSPFTPVDEYASMDEQERLKEGEEGWGMRDIPDVWGSEGARRFNKGAGPMMLLPKVDHPSMLSEIDRMLSSLQHRQPGIKTPLIASIESPEALLNLTMIAGWRGRAMELVGLTFAAEDFCAATRITRTRARTELLYARSSIVVAARAFGISAIDMVCVDYKNMDVLREECKEGRELGFDAKQAIHPSQVDVITDAFAPSQAEIDRAQQIMDVMAGSTRGAEGIKTAEGKEEMIDKPMILQARRTLRDAKAAGRLGQQTRLYTTSARRPHSRYYSSTSPTKKACPECGTSLSLAASPCPECKTLVPIPSEILYHSLFGLVSDDLAGKENAEILKSLVGGGFEIDVKATRLQFLRRQQGIHPDSVAGKSERERDLAALQSSQVNKAYNVLIDPLSRANYLLQEYGTPVEEADSLTDPVLLMEVMEAREELEEASSEEEVEAVRAANKEKTDSVIGDLAAAFATQPPDLERAKILAIELQYLKNLDNAAKEWQPGKRIEITH